MKVGEAYVGEDGQWYYYTEEDIRKMEKDKTDWSIYTPTYEMDIALQAFADGFKIYTYHPDD